ncbi:hypothetical protein EC973_008942 [Apophysomyces ossiformis]|uniref:Retrotransposon gag domain-containing protein n=1 Tax=Apophysomyces ossiformis TaxID=679940 RepID=A0A8H7BE77_9FUNG|nr:hypothetical protein EC973_008942 [Apophysomyces ossiformis]
MSSEEENPVKTVKNQAIQETASVIQDALFSKHGTPESQKLDKLVIAYQEALPAAGPDQLKVIQQDIVKTKETLRTFHDVYHQEYQENSSTEKWLALAIYHDHDAWFENRLAKRNLTWSKACKIFIQWFESPDQMIAMASKAYSMVMDRQESVLDYSTHFQKAYYEGGIVDNEGLAL